MRFISLFLAAVVFVSLTALGQPSAGPSVGIFTTYNYNIHDADFGGIPVPANCCRDYKDGDGNGYTVGVTYSLPIGADWAVSGRLTFSDYSAHTEYWESTRIFVGLPGGDEILDATFNNSIRTTIQSVCIEPVVEYVGLGFLVPYAGCSVAFPVTQEFVQQEYLLTPDGLMFVNDGGRFRNNTSGDIPNAPWAYVSVVAGLSGRIPVGYNVVVAPDISYLYTLNDVMNGSHWQPHAVRAGVSILMPL